MPDLPTDLAYGKVTGRFLTAVGDGPDGASLPDAAVPTGLTIKFTPKTALFRTTSPSVTVVARPITCTIDAEGNLLDPQGVIGVWLITGLYSVTYSGGTDFTLPAHEIAVTTDHTDADPLDLTIAMPPGPVLTPTQYTELNGRITVLESAPGGGGGVTDHGALTGLTDDDHPQYLNNTRGDVRYYTKTANDTLLAGKAPTTRTISTGTGLTGGGDLSANRTLAVDFTAVSEKAHSHWADDVTRGGGAALAANVMGDGTPDGSKFLRDDRQWVSLPAGTTPPDASASVKGLVQLAGDLGGTAAAPTVPGLAGKANSSHTHAAADVSSGTLNIARIPTGTSGTTVALGDHTHDARYVRTVNGTGPDGAGNVTVSGAQDVQVDTLTLPPTPRVGQVVTVLAKPSTTFPAGVTWDTGGAPTIAEGRLLVTAVWSGTDWVGTYGLPFPQAPSAPDTTAPIAGTLASSAVTSSSFTLAVTGASDAVALHANPYAFSTDNGSTWSVYQSSASYNVTGKAASTAYTCRHRVKDAAGNVSTGTAITVTTSAGAASLATSIQALSPTGYWKLTETSGSAAADSSGNGRNGTCGGVEGTDFDRTTLGLKVKTLTGTMTVPEHSAFDPTSAGTTVFALVRPSLSTSASDWTVFEKAGSTRPTVQLAINAGQLYGGYLGASSGWVSLAYSNAASFPQQMVNFNAVAMTAPAPGPSSHPTFYIDNNTPQQTGKAGSASWSYSAGVIKASPTFPNVLTISHLAVFPRPLTATEVGGLVAAARSEGLIP